jgi:thiamine biosynthesis lipoprotein
VGDQHFESEGRRLGHVIDPRSGRPAEGVLNATVLAEDATTADALATALLVGGPPLARAWCAESPETVAVLALEDEPRTLHVFGSSGGLQLEPSAGTCLVMDGG